MDEMDQIITKYNKKMDHMHIQEQPQFTLS